MFPRAGGMYHYLREAYGPLWGFLYGWAAFLVIMSGGIAALAVAFGDVPGSFFPFVLHVEHGRLPGDPRPHRWTITGGARRGRGRPDVADGREPSGSNVARSCRTASACSDRRHPASGSPDMAAPMAPPSRAAPSRCTAFGVRHRHDRGPLDLRRLVRPHLLGGRAARSRPEPPARADPRHGDRDRPLHARSTWSTSAR